jgi:hypothetical protein
MRAAQPFNQPFKCSRNAQTALTVLTKQFP